MNLELVTHSRKWTSRVRRRAAEAERLSQIKDEVGVFNPWGRLFPYDCKALRPVASNQTVLHHFLTLLFTYAVIQPGA